ncbi:MAG: small ribosomal subunit Rsm22 family protein [Janthinobacterium lividum]
MLLPPSLRLKLDLAFKECDKQNIQSARRGLTQRYRESGDRSALIPPFMTTRWDRLSYMATRMPATYAVCHHVLNQLQKYDTEITSLLDLGSGPGTALWAAHDLFSYLNQVTLIEQDQSLSQEGAALFNKDIHQKNITFLWQSLQSAIPFKSHDLVCLSYVLGELPARDLQPLIEAAWQATTEFLILLEPGTPDGFQRIKEARAQLIQQGAFILAPCPHDLECPMVQGDWCHFSGRLARSALHRQIKESSLPYEDEKYSYIIASKKTRDRPLSRIIRRPKQGSGHFILDLCTENGLERKIISKKMPTLYRAARQASWGDPGPENAEVLQDETCSSNSK